MDKPTSNGPVYAASGGYVAVVVSDLFDGDWSQAWSNFEPEMAALAVGAVFIVVKTSKAMWRKFVDRDGDGIADFAETDETDYALDGGDASRRDVRRAAKVSV